MYLPTSYFATIDNTRSKNDICLPIILPPQTMHDSKMKMFAYLLFCHRRQYKIKNLLICQTINLPPQAIQDPKMNVFAYQLFCPPRQYKIQKRMYLPTYHLTTKGN